MFTVNQSPLKAIILSASLCLTAAAQQAPQQRNFPQPPPAKEVSITAIPGVIAADAKWKIAYQSPENSDGIVGTADGGLLFAQEQTNRINKLDKDDKFSEFLKNGHGPGSVGIGPKGQIYAVERTCTDPGRTPEDCKENTGIAILTPTRRVLADNYMGKNLGRVNDLVLDRKGGAYFTSGGLYYTNSKGQVISIGENLRTNGVQLSRDEKTLYVTNGPTIAAFDVQPDGSAKNQREFGKLEAGGNGDGLAIDSEGRLYCATSNGVQVLSPEGKYLGVIPIPRNGISVAFSGPGKQWLYVVGNGAVDHYGREITTPPTVRNTAMTIYKIQMISTGFKGRAK